MSLVRRWAFISALLLISIIVLIYMGIVRYAQSTRIPYDGISVSEEVDRIVGMLSLWNAEFFGLLILAATFLCWRAFLKRARELELDTAQQRRIRASLMVNPLASFALYMLIHYSLGMLVSNSLNTGGGVATPTPIHDPLPR